MKLSVTYKAGGLAGRAPDSGVELRADPARHHLVVERLRRPAHERQVQLAGVMAWGTQCSIILAGKIIPLKDY
jgi:hypothetical protein